MIPSGIQWFLFRTGICATSHLEAGAFIRTKQGVPHPDIQFHFYRQLLEIMAGTQWTCMLTKWVDPYITFTILSTATSGHISIYTNERISSQAAQQWETSLNKPSDYYKNLWILLCTFSSPVKSMIDGQWSMWYTNVLLLLWVTSIKTTSKPVCILASFTAWLLHFFTGSCGFTPSHKSWQHQIEISQSVWASSNRSQPFLHWRGSLWPERCSQTDKRDICTEGIWSVPWKGTTARFEKEHCAPQHIPFLSTVYIMPHSKCPFCPQSTLCPTASALFVHSPYYAPQQVPFLSTVHIVPTAAALFVHSPHYAPQ